ncbi:hypothetical protein [Methylobacter sp.]|uniref:hypothetical protein n=1 Tax=Methylobacter sp. TaxID=2051955 RepID=UPI003DA6CCA7
MNNIPENVEKELEAILQQRYKDLEGNKNIHRSISYERSREPKVRYEADVRYFLENWSGAALFQYIERRDEKLGYAHYWYCRKDWRD